MYPLAMFDRSTSLNALRDRSWLWRVDAWFGAGRGVLRRLAGVIVVCGVLACQRAVPTPPLTVFAAASLREVYTELGARFAQRHKTAAPTFQFDGSQRLRTQLEHGAKADVFASADLRHMQALEAQSVVQAAVVFAGNELVVVVGKSAQGVVRTWDEVALAKRVVLGTPEVPAGQYAAQLLARAPAAFAEKVRAAVVSRELNVRQVLAKVRLGEADVGFVYRTDARLAPELAVVAVPEALREVTRYPIAVVTASTQPALAHAWVAFLQTPEAQAMLVRHGFTVEVLQ